MWWLIGGLAASIVGGGLAGWANSEAKRKQLAQQKAEIENSITKGDDALQDYLESLENEYNNTMAQLADNKKQNQSSLGYATTQRSSDAMTNSMLNTKQQELEYQELAQLLASGEQSVGQATASAASTGFRNTGSVQSTIESVQKQADTAASNAFSQIKLSSAQRFANAANTYFSQSSSIEGYQQALETIERLKKENTKTYEINKEQKTSEWEQQRDLYQQMLDSGDYNWDGGKEFNAWLEGLANPLSNIGNTLISNA